MVAPSLDWFEPAFLSAASIPLALDRVLCIEESKVHFTRCLRAALCNPVPHGPDRIAALSQDIKLLQQTFQHRLGILAIDRPQAWFRHSSTAERGPFAVAVFEEPVFARFDDCRAVAVRHLLPELWRNRQVSCADYDPALSLWGRLLQLNRRLEQINQLPAPFSDVRLDELPEAIPDELQSPALHKFGSQIAQRMKSCQRELDACYEQLWGRSESFLYALHIQYLSNKARQQQRQHQEAGARQRQKSDARSDRQDTGSRYRDSRTDQRETGSRSDQRDMGSRYRDSRTDQRDMGSGSDQRDMGSRYQDSRTERETGSRYQDSHSRQDQTSRNRQGARQDPP